MFGKKKINEEAYIVKNMRGVPVYDLRTGDFLLDFDDAQKSVLKDLINSNSPGAREIFKDIAFKGLPFDFMVAFINAREYTNSYGKGYVTTNERYRREFDKFIHCNLSVRQFGICANCYEIFRYINDVPRYSVGTLQLLEKLAELHPEQLKKLHDGMDEESIVDLCKSNRIFWEPDGFGGHRLFAR